MSSTIKNSETHELASVIGVRKFSLDEYRRLGDLGILTEDDRVELMHGLISPKMIHSPVHDATIGIVEGLLRDRIDAGWIIRVQSAVTIEDSELEPDIAIVIGPPTRYLSQHPQGIEIGLIVEIAESSVSRDRIKAEIYASVGIQFYWIVNLAEDQIEVFSNPTRTPVAGYLSIVSVKRGQTIPLTIGNKELETVAVSSVLVRQ